MSTELSSIDGGFERIEQRLTRVADWLLDLVFPPTCANCGRVDFRFCADCLGDLEATPFALASPRSEDLHKTLDETLATGKHSGVLRMAVRAFKYQGARELSEPLAERLLQALRGLDWNIDAVVPVPLSANREAERGYNQSALLSQHVVLETGIALRADFLRRIRDTDHQARLSEPERRENVRNAFEAKADVRSQRILLIDDVITTGSTIRECALALRRRGAEAVYGMAVSHA